MRLVKILLDEMVPRKFGPSLFGHDVKHVIDCGWRHISNGSLLAPCENEGFDVFITKDGNIPYQQNTIDRRFAIIVVKPITQDLADLISLSPQVMSLLGQIEPGTITVVRAQ